MQPHRGGARGLFFKRSLYLARRARFLQELAMRGVIEVCKVDTSDNKADRLTKVLTVARFKALRHKMLGLGGKPSVAAVSAGRIGKHTL